MSERAGDIYVSVLRVQNERHDDALDRSIIFEKTILLSRESGPERARFLVVAIGTWTVMKGR